MFSCRAVTTASASNMYSPQGGQSMSDCHVCLNYTWLTEVIRMTTVCESTHLDWIFTVEIPSRDHFIPVCKDSNEEITECRQRISWSRAQDRYSDAVTQCHTPALSSHGSFKPIDEYPYCTEGAMQLRR